MGLFSNNEALRKLQNKKKEKTVLVKRTASEASSDHLRPVSTPAPTSVRQALSNGKPRHNKGNTHNSSQNESPPRPEKRDKKDRLKPVKCADSRRASPATPTPRLTEDDEGESEDDEHARKKRRTTQNDGADDTRKIRDPHAFSADEESTFPMVHTFDIANTGTLENPNDKYTDFFTALDGDEEEAPTIELQYPHASQRERYQLVLPKDKGDLYPTREMADTMARIAHSYLDTAERKVVNDPATGIIHSLTIAARLNRVGAQTQFINAVEKFNRLITKARDEGMLARNLDEIDSDGFFDLIKYILYQIDVRVVSPRVKMVLDYKMGSDNVYGKLEPKLLNRIFQQTKLKSNQVFVDLGSGVGNCVLQAALQIGCESHGCEMMENPAKLADLQAEEFRARCRLWGIRPGTVSLIHDNFLNNKDVDEVLKRADVVLINNQAFTSQLNENLKLKFLDLKDGCQIVCLVPFRPFGHKVNELNKNDVANQLSVEQFDRYGGDVSWADKPGKWYIHRKDSAKGRF